MVVQYPHNSSSMLETALPNQVVEVSQTQLGTVSNNNLTESNTQPVAITDSVASFLDLLKQRGGIVEDLASIDANQLFIDLTDPDKRPIWSYDDLALNPDEELSPILTWCKIGGRESLPVEGIVTFIAKPKQGKSLSTYALTIPLLTNQIFNTVTPLRNPKRVCVFDLEMGRNTLSQRVKLQRDNLQMNNNFVVFPLVKYDAKQRADIILQKVKQHKPDIVIIDQVAKLLSNINDPSEATRVIRILETVASNCSCWCVIHENKGADTNARGHIGQELAIASEETYRIWKKQGVFHIKGVEARGVDMEGMDEVCFCYDETNGIQDASVVVREQSITKERNKAQELRELFTDIFKDHPEGLTPGDINEGINNKRVLGKQTKWSKVTISTKRDDAVELGILYKRPDLHNSRNDRFIYFLSEEANQATHDICSGRALVDDES